MPSRTFIAWKDKSSVSIQWNITQLCKKKWISDICYNMDKPRKHYVKWNKSDAKGQILHDSTYEVPITENSKRQKVEQK